MAPGRPVVWVRVCLSLEVECPHYALLKAGPSLRSGFPSLVGSIPLHADRRVRAPSVLLGGRSPRGAEFC